MSAPIAPPEVLKTGFESISPENRRSCDSIAERERYSAALEQHPKLLEVRNSLGVLFFETGELELALK
jgi:hypothetical protein